MPTAEIEELKQRLVSQLSPVSLYLFGSYADESYTDDSDFDFYVIVKDSEKDLAALTAKAYRSIRDVKKRPVDILVGTQSRFEQRKVLSTVENEVFRKGVLLYGV